MITLNETPVRTSKNFNINHIKLEDVNIPKNVPSFHHVTIVGENQEMKVEQSVKLGLDFTYGVGKIIEDDANQNLKISIDSKEDKELMIHFDLDQENPILADHIEMTANEQTKATVIVQYVSQEEGEYFHQGSIKLFAKKGANVNVIITNFLNQTSHHFLSIENVLEEGANVNFTMIDFGSKNSISNYYSNLIGNASTNTINTIYLGNHEQLFDINYIAELRGEKTNVNIEVQGALADTAKKHFKGTIDFKKGAKKATGNENESCMLLSDTAKSLALPMLLCSEEEVEGNHSSSSGKIDEKELFYIMSRGFEQKEAMKLVIKAKFNSILETIKNEKLKEEILSRIDEKLM